MYVSVTVLQIFHHSFHTTPEFSIYQKHHHNFPMFMATYNQDSLWRFLSNLHWFQWHLVWWIMARQVLTYPTNAKFDMGNVNISKLLIFNLLFSWIEPQLLFESILFRSKSSSSRTSRTLLVLAQGIGVFCKLQSHRLGIKRIGWEKKLVMELDFNLAGDSGKENTDSILAHLDCFHTVKYQKKKHSSTYNSKYFNAPYSNKTPYFISLHASTFNLMTLCKLLEQPLYFVHIFSIWLLYKRQILY